MIRSASFLITSLLTILISAVAFADGVDDDPGHMQELMAAPLASPPPLMPDDRAAFSRVFLQRDGARIAAKSPPELALDGDGGSAAVLDADGSSALELEFVGAPRWFNEVQVLTDASDFQIDYMDLNRDWQPFAAGVGRSDGKESILVAGDEVKARGLRIMPRSTASATARLFEISAWFNQIDPDEADAGKKSHIGRLEYFWANDYPGTNNDLSLCDDDARGLRDALPGNWVKYGHGNAGARERYVKRHDMGGSNQWHNDAADLAYFAGHGSGSRFDSRWNRNLGATIWGNQTSDDANTVPGDALGAWGNRNLEWTVMASCQTLSNASWPYWATTMDRLHLILGASTNVADARYGGRFGDYLVDNGIFDSAKKVKSAWFDVVEYYNGGYKIAVVLGETSSMGNDHIWGQGSVAGDPSHDGWYYYWWYNVGANKADGPMAQTASTSSDRRSGSLRSFPAKSERGYDVTIDPSLLVAPKQGEMNTYIVLPSPVDEGVMQELAAPFCEQFGFLCEGAPGPGDRGVFNFIDGGFELRVCEKTRSVHFADTVNHLDFLKTRPNLPIGQEAIGLSDQILGALNLLPRDLASVDVDYLWQGAADGSEPDQPIIDPSQTFAIGARVCYRRGLDDGFGQTVPVMGPGGSMTVTLGDEGQLQRIYQSGWRPLTTGQQVGVISISEVVDALNTRGSDAVINGVTLVADAVEIVGFELGFYEPECEDPTQMIRPIYRMDTVVFEPNGTQSPYEMFVWVDSSPLGALIEEPRPGTCVAEGDEVCLLASATGGVPPYSFEWHDDLTGLVGMEQQLCVPMPPPQPGHSVFDDARTYEVIVTDALGNSSTQTIEVCYSFVTDVPSAGVPAQLELAQNQPNPFNPVTRIHFGVPGDDGASVAVRLLVYDARGRIVRTLVDEPFQPGRHFVDWNGRGDDGRNVASGVYHYRLEMGEQSVTRAMVLLK